MTYLEILIVVLLFFPYVGFLRWRLLEYAVEPSS